MFKISKFKISLNPKINGRSRRSLTTPKQTKRNPRLAHTNGYHTKGRGPIPLNRENVLNFGHIIMQELRQGNKGQGSDFQPRASQSIYSIFKDLGINILKKSINDNLSSETEKNDFNEEAPYETSNKHRPHEMHYLAEDFIKILIKFDHKPLDQAWDSRPDIKSFTIEDLSGELNDKKKFLEHLKIAGHIYKSTIDLCEAQQYKIYDRSIPDHLIVTDLITIADSYNVKILSNRGIPFDMYMSGNIIDGSFTANDLVGRVEDRDSFLKTVNIFSSDIFRNAFNNISHHLYGIPVPDHINAEWVIATAKNHNIVIISNKGKEFNMNWQTRPDSFVGYPPGSYGGMDFVTSVCLKMKVLKKN